MTNFNNKNVLKILGNISPYPTKNANCPGYLFQINCEKILLDCGPGISKILQFPKDLDGLNIFISHFHKDHYIDIYSIAYASFVYHNLGMLHNRIELYIPKMNEKDYGYEDYMLLKNLREHYFEIIEYDENSQFIINDVKITFCKNYHSILTYSTKIEYNEKKYVYTSDLGYKSKDDIVNFAKNADILLIENTFLISDNIVNEYHLNTMETTEIANLANVKKLLLTHFWPEYKSDNYFKEAKALFNNADVVNTNQIFNL